MTVAQTSNKSRQVGNNITVAFPANIKIFAETDITVKTIVRATDVLANDLILNDAGALGFTVVFDTEAETLTVTVNTAPTATEDIQILRVLPLTQSTDFPTATKFPAVSNENALDKNLMIIQDQQEQLDRAFVLPEESSATNPSLPEPSSRRALIWDPAEDGTLINSTNDPDEQATDAAASAAAASTSEGNAATFATTAGTEAATATAAAVSAAASANSQIRFTFDTSIVMADPGAGDFRLNNATVASVTAIAFDATMAQTGFPDISDYLATWDDSTNTVTGQVTLIKNGEPETFALFNVTAVTDNTGWLQVTVAHVQSNGTFSAADNIDTFFARAGDAGGAFTAADIDGQTEDVVAAADNFVYTKGGVLKRDAVQGLLDLVSSGLVLLATATASSSTSVDFTSFIDSTFEKYEIHYDNVIPASDGSTLHMLMDTDGGASFDTSSGSYFYNQTFMRSNSNTVNGGSSETDGFIPIAGSTDVGNASTEGCSGIIYISDPANTATFTKFYGHSSWAESSNHSGLNTVGGEHRVAAGMDAVRFKQLSGNIASGKFKLYGVQKS